MLGASGFSPCLHNVCFFFQGCRKELERLIQTKMLAAHLGKVLTGFCCCVHDAIREPGDDDLEGDLAMNVSFGECVTYCRSSHIRNETNWFQQIIAWQSLLIPG